MLLLVVRAASEVHANHPGLLRGVASKVMPLLDCPLRPFGPAYHLSG